MNTEIIIHPTLQHLGLVTSNMDVTLDWYRKVLGMALNYRASIPVGAPFSELALVSNDEAHHRISFFKMHDQPESGQSSDTRLQHIAFEYATLDELLGSYVRLKSLNIVPKMALDEGTQISFYYEDPDKNRVELNVNNYGNDWTATEHMQLSHATGKRPPHTVVDPDKMVLARKAGLSPWEVHERACAGEYFPAKRG